jgi:hypothetical protein
MITRAHAKLRNKTENKHIYKQNTKWAIRRNIRDIKTTRKIQDTLNTYLKPHTTVEG